jgi:hypothetical protein
MVGYHVRAPWSHVAKSFSWDEDLLHQHIEQYKGGYDEEDPKTWPLIPLAFVKDKSKSTKEPPSGVAYTADAFVLANPQCRLFHGYEPVQAILPGGTFSQGWISHPFNINQCGYLRSYIGIPKADYELCMQHFGRSATPTKGMPNHNSQATMDLACPSAVVEMANSTSIENTVNAPPAST